MRGAIFWTVWLEKNKLVFTPCNRRSLKSLSIQIISLDSFLALTFGQ
jgi:hypothetical protein